MSDDELELIHGRRPGDIYIRHRSIYIPSHRRTLSTLDLFSAGYSNVGSSIYYALGIVALFALGATPLALLAAGLLFVFTVLTYSEATAAIPEAGAASSFARRGWNELFSFLAGWATMLSYIVAISISTFVAAAYLAVFIPAMDEPYFCAGFAVVVILVRVLLNIFGVNEPPTLRTAFAVVNVLMLTGLIIVGGILLVNAGTLIETVRIGVAPDWPSFLYGVAFATIAFTGVETISNMAEEARSPATGIPRAYGLLVAASLVLFTGISVVAVSAVPVEAINGQHVTELGSTYIAKPVVAIAERLPPPYNSVFEPIVGILVASTLLVAAQTGVLGVSRMSFAMGSYYQLPAFLHRLHPRLRTPYLAIILSGAIAIALVLVGDIIGLASAYIFGAMLTFTLAHVSVIGMRIRAADMPRPFRIPLNIRLGGRDLPVTAILGALGTFSVWLTITLTQPFARIVGLLWLALGLLLYVSYRRVQGLPLTVAARRERWRVRGAPRIKG